MRRSMTCYKLSVISAVLALLSCASIGSAADWPQWRGPLGTGESEEKTAPLTWTKTENVKWRVALDGPGNSTPIVIGQKVLITHAPTGGKLRGIQCYDRKTGEL